MAARDKRPFHSNEKVNKKYRSILLYSAVTKRIKGNNRDKGT
jgi:hypothetical protein